MSFFVHNRGKENAHYFGTGVFTVEITLVPCRLGCADTGYDCFIDINIFFINIFNDNLFLPGACFAVMPLPVIFRNSFSKS
jgi:hypothetical protein